MRYAVILALIFAASANAQTVDGWIDGYGAWNHDLALNVAALEVVEEPKPLGFHVTLVAGDSAVIVVRHVYQASVTYDAKVVQLEAGVYPSHIGFESFFSKDDWNYTRGWLAEQSPYYQSGLKISRTLNSRWSAQLHVMHGWQNVSDPHAPAAIGTQLAYADARVSAAFNTYADAHRKFGDLVATVKTTPKLSVGISVDRGRQLPANWLGLAAFARYAFDDRNALALRVERFRDPDNGISGFAQTVSERTLTYELRPQKHLIFKFEARRDRSTAPVFNDNKERTLAIASAVVTFGS